MLVRFLIWFSSFFTSMHIRREKSGPLYLSRYYLFGRLGRRWRDWIPLNLYLHRFYISDKPLLHNHPWSWAVSLMLAGGYDEYRLEDATVYGLPLIRKHRVYPGWLNWIPRGRYHWVTVLDHKAGYWTLVLSGPQWGKRWGFLVGSRHVDSHAMKSRELSGQYDA